MADYIKLKEIKPGSTIKEMVEIINNNFTDIENHGGGPKGDAGVDGSVGPEGKRGKGIFVIPEVIEGNEWEDYINEILEEDRGSDGEGKYKDGDVIVYKSFLYAVEKNADGTGLVSKCVGSLKGEKGDKGDSGNSGVGGDIGAGGYSWDAVSVFGKGGYQFADGYSFLVVGSGINESNAEEYGIDVGDDISHSLWVLDGKKGIVLVGAKRTDGIRDKSTISLSDDSKLVLKGHNGVVVEDFLFDDGDIRSNREINIISHREINIGPAYGININAPGTKGSFSAHEINIEGEKSITIKVKENSYVDRGSIEVSDTGLTLSGTGKNIYVGKSALLGYDVDIVGKTHIDGDLVVSGSVEGSLMYEIGDFRICSKHKPTPNGWFDNSILPNIKKCPFFKESNNDPVTYDMYTRLKDMNPSKGLPDITEDEFNDYSKIADIIINTYDSSNTITLIYGYSGEGEHLNTADNLFINPFDFKNQFEENYYDGDDNINGVVYNGPYEGYIIINNRNNKSILIFFVFNFSGYKYKHDMLNKMAEVLDYIGNQLDRQFDDISECIGVINGYLSQQGYYNVTVNELQDFNPNYASISIEGFENYFIDTNAKPQEAQYKIINNFFTLPSPYHPSLPSPSEGDEHLFKYIVKYKDTGNSLASGVGNRKPKSE